MEQEPWLQLTDQGESNLWYSRFLLFRDMGPVRTMIGALRLEDASAGRQSHKRIVGNWRDTAKKFQWIERAEAWDVYRREKVFTSGYAHDLKRIQKLDELAAKLVEKVEAMISNMKPSKGGFQEFLYKSLLDTLEAIAHETGGRSISTAKPDVNVNVNTTSRVVFFDPDADPGSDIDLNMPAPESGGTDG